MRVINRLPKRREPAQSECAKDRRLVFATLTTLAAVGMKHPATRAKYHALRRRFARRVLVIEGGAARA